MSVLSPITFLDPNAFSFFQAEEEGPPTDGRTEEEDNLRNGDKSVRKDDSCNAMIPRPSSTYLEEEDVPKVNEGGGCIKYKHSPFLEKTSCC